MFASWYPPWLRLDFGGKSLLEIDTFLPAVAAAFDEYINRINLTENGNDLGHGAHETKLINLFTEIIQLRVTYAVE